MHLDLVFPLVVEIVRGHVVNGIRTVRANRCVTGLKTVVNHCHDLHKDSRVHGKDGLLVTSEQDVEKAVVGLAQLGISRNVINRYR